MENLRMNKYKLLYLLPLVSLGACTSIHVQPVGSDFKPEYICIEENPKVIVEDFISIIRNRIEHHGYSTRIVQPGNAENCEYLLTYVAYKNWDMGNYMHKAELRLDKNNEKIASAEYRLKGKGGFSLMKWNSTKSKMNPVVDELLGKKDS